MDMARLDAARVEGLSDRGQHARRPAQITLNSGQLDCVGQESIDIRRLVPNDQNLQG